MLCLVVIASALASCNFIAACDSQISLYGAPYYDFEYHRSTISLFGWDPGVLAYCYDAQALYFLGFSERADNTAENAVALARRLASPFNEALCFALHATYYAYRRDAPKALEMADAALKIATDRGFLHWIALASIDKG